MAQEAEGCQLPGSVQIATEVTEMKKDRGKATQMLCAGGLHVGLPQRTCCIDRGSAGLNFLSSKWKSIPRARWEEVGRTHHTLKPLPCKAGTQLCLQANPLQV